jgi:hypothetical protein
MLKTIDIYPIRQGNVKKYTFQSLAQTKRNIPSFRNGQNNKAFSYIPNHTKESFQMNKELLVGDTGGKATKNFYKLRKLCTKENSRDQKNNESSFSICTGPLAQESFWSGHFMPSTTFNKGSIFIDKKNLRIMVKRLWFFNTAAPIPGVSSLKKKKRL